MAAQQIGIVTVVIGHVVAVNADGEERVLAVGDAVYADELIRTSDAGAVTVQFNDGGWFDLGRDAQAVMDADVYSPDGPEGEAAGAVASVEDIQAAILAGGDPTQLLPPTAAGSAAGGGLSGEGGHSFIALDHDFVAVNPAAGIPTNAEPLLFDNTIDIILPTEAPEPEIVVSVEVDVEIGGGEPGEGGVVLIPGGTPITGGVSGASVIEGSDGSAHPVTFLITLSQVSDKPVTVTYTIVPGTASNPDDYFDGAQTGTVTIPAGYIGFSVTQNIVADILVEGDETFKIVLSNPIGATLTNDTATVTIIDDDRAPVANDDTNWVQEDNFAGEAEAVATSGNVLQSIAHPGDPSPTLSFADAADNDDNPLILTWGAETAVYGNIVKNADGSYVYQLDNGNPAIQGLSAGETLTETFTYTITDGVNTPDTATLTITIFGADDGVTITGIGSTQGDETVFENDLPAGSSPNDPALTQTGSFNIVALDGIASVTVGGTVLTLAQVQGLGTTPVVIDTAYGALTLTGYAGNAQGGTVSYSYTLDTTVDNDAQAGATTAAYLESIGVTVTDEDGSAANSSVNIRIVDDAPTANVDGPYGVTEDGVSSVGGDVLSNDASGADAPGVFVGWGAGDATAIAGLNTYGTLTQNGDGTWSYVLDNGRAATQALTASDSLSYTLNYTMADADGDPSPSTLTITITGADDGASVETAVAEGPDATVYESGLEPAGSNAAADTETTDGTFTVSATDGIASVVIGGTVFTLAQVQAFATTNGVVNTGQGTLTLTGYSGTATGGTISYSYTLSATIDNDSVTPTGDDAVTAEHFDDSVALTVNGVGGTTASDDLVIRIVDDAPTANVDGPYGVTEDGVSSVGGDVLSNDASGADAPGVFVGWGAGDATAIAGLNTYGTLTQNGDGTWSYVLDNGRAATQALTASDSLSYTLNYTMADADGDPSPSTLTITITGADDGASVETAVAEGPDATVYESGLEPAGSNAAADTETTDGTFTVSATDGIASVVIGGTVFTLAQVQAFATTNGVVNTGQGTLTLTGYSGTATGGTISYSYTLSATIDNDSVTPTGDDAVTAEHFDDSVALTVNGVGGTTASDDLVIRIVDDAPTAVDDADSVTEGLGNTADGNVFTGVGGTDGNTTDGNADTSGADGASVTGAYCGPESASGGATYTTVTATGVTIAGVYGDLHLASDGSYTYTLKTASIPAEVSSETFTYRVTDGDGDIDLAQLVISLDQDSRIPAIAASSVTVDEEGLPAREDEPAGTAAAGDSETNSSSFTIDTHGETLSVLSIGGASYNLVAGGSQVLINNATGTLTVTGVTLSGGIYTVDYSYTLKDNSLAHSVQGNTDTVNGPSFVVSATDATGDTNTSSVQVIISDDAPVTANDYQGVIVDENGAGSSSGNVLDNDAIGADGAATGGPVTSIAFGGASYNVPADGTQQVQGDYGLLTISSTGAYTYVYNAVPGEDPVSVSPGGLSGAVLTAYDNTSPYTVGGDLNLNAVPDATYDIHGGGGANKQGFGVDGAKGPGTLDFGEELIVKLEEPIYGEFTFQIGEYNANQSDLGDMTWGVYGADGHLIDSGTFADLGGTATANGTYTGAPISFDEPVAYIVFGMTDATGSGYTVTNIEYVDLSYPTGIDDFVYTVTDGDGDTSTSHLYMTSDQYIEDTLGGAHTLTGGAGDDILVGNDGADILIGASGNDVLSGGAGGDTFVFHHGETGVDTITDFNVATVGSGGDVLDISDLLADAGISTTDFANSPGSYLVVTAGTDTTVAFDATGGDHSDAVQIATLQNVNTTLNTLIGNGQIDATP